VSDAPSAEQCSAEGEAGKRPREEDGDAEDSSKRTKTANEGEGADAANGDEAPPPYQPPAEAPPRYEGGAGGNQAAYPQQGQVCQSSRWSCSLRISTGLLLTC
jgi:hypothetical protein